MTWTSTGGAPSLVQGLPELSDGGDDFSFNGHDHVSRLQAGSLGWRAVQDLQDQHPTVHMEAASQLGIEGGQLGSAYHPHPQENGRGIPLLDLATGHFTDVSRGVPARCRVLAPGQLPAVPCHLGPNGIQIHPQVPNP